jgi:hypothetical protein
VIVEQDPAKPRIVLHRGDAVKAVGRGVDPMLCWAWYWLWVLTAPDAGTCVCTEKRDSLDDELTPDFAATVLDLAGTDSI